jgi:hypothetical protein
MTSGCHRVFVGIAHESTGALGPAGFALPVWGFPCVWYSRIPPNRPMDNGGTNTYDWVVSFSLALALACRQLRPTLTSPPMRFGKKNRDNSLNGRHENPWCRGGRKERRTRQKSRAPIFVGAGHRMWTPPRHVRATWNVNSDSRLRTRGWAGRSPRYREGLRESSTGSVLQLTTLESFDLLNR